MIAGTLHRAAQKAIDLETRRDLFRRSLHVGEWRDANGARLRESRCDRLANGPVRVAFELDYEPWGPPQARVSETKRISLDLGQNLSRVEARFSAAGPSRSLPVAEQNGSTQ